MSDAVRDAWRALAREGERLGGLSLRTLFEHDPERFASFSFGHEDLLVDLSKEKIDRPALDALLALAGAVELPARRDALFAGKHVNATEDRAALHMALRGGTDERLVVGGIDVARDVGAARERFLAFAEEVRSGRYGARDGGRFTDVVHIGIGGSHLGPEMTVRALRPDHDGPRIHFVSNVDGADLADATARLDPGRTLVLVASKTFTTLETMTNARSARRWLDGAVAGRAGTHMAAISSNVRAAAAFGIEENRVFGFRDWVGGRYSLWSAIGLPVAVAVGAERFRELLAGAAAMDHHFRSAPLERNLPVLMGLVSVWRRNVMGWPSVALIPYDQRLERFPACVQQLAMESNGKRVARDGRPAPDRLRPSSGGSPAPTPSTPSSSFSTREPTWYRWTSSSQPSLGGPIPSTTRSCSPTASPRGRLLPSAGPRRKRGARWRRTGSPVPPPSASPPTGAFRETALRRPSRTAGSTLGRSAG